MNPSGRVIFHSVSICAGLISNFKGDLALLILPKSFSFPSLEYLLKERPYQSLNYKTPAEVYFSGKEKENSRYLKHDKLLSK